VSCFPHPDFTQDIISLRRHLSMVNHNLEVVLSRLKNAIRTAQENYEVAHRTYSKNSELLFAELNKTPRSDKIGELDENGNRLWENMQYALGALNALEELKESIYNEK